MKLRWLRPFPGTPWSELGTWSAWLAGWALVGVAIVYVTRWAFGLVVAFAILAGVPPEWVRWLAVPWWAVALGWLGIFVVGLGGWGSLAAVLWSGPVVLSREGRAK